MSLNEQFSKDRGEGKDRVLACAGLDSDDAVRDPEMVKTLRDFRLSVRAWSEAAYQRPRVLEFAPRRGAWRKAAAWALGSVLVVGSAGGGLLGYQYRQEQARIAAARQVERQRQLEEERARQAEEELAKVDNDVSREVPNALEPLAQLMTSDETR